MKTKTKIKMRNALVSRIITHSRRLGMTVTVGGVEYIKEVRIQNGTRELKNLCRELGIDKEGYLHLIDIENQSGVDSAYLNLTNEKVKVIAIKKILDFLQKFNGRKIEISAEKDQLNNYDMLNGNHSYLYSDIPREKSQTLYVLMDKWGMYTQYAVTEEDNIKTISFNVSIPELSENQISNLQGIENEFLKGVYIPTGEGGYYLDEEYAFLIPAFSNIFYNEITRYGEAVNENGINIREIRKMTLENAVLLIAVSIGVRVEKESRKWYQKVFSSFEKLLNNLSIGIIQVINQTPILRQIKKYEERLIGGLLGLSVDEMNKMETEMLKLIAISYLTGGWASEIETGSMATISITEAAIETGATIYLSSKQIILDRINKLTIKQEEEQNKNKKEESNENEYIVFGNKTGNNSHRKIKYIKEKSKNANRRHFK